MAPGQILIEFVIPIVSVAATVLGIFVVKKRRDKKKAEACKTIDMADNHQLRIESLENMINTLTHSVLVCATEEKVEGQIREANDRLRLDISQWDENKPSKGEMERHVDEAMIGLRGEFCKSIANTVKKPHPDEESDSTIAVELDEARASWRKDIDNKIEDAVAEVSSRCAVEWRKDIDKKIQETVQKIAADDDGLPDDYFEMSGVFIRKEINKKIQEYDLALTKWVKKQIEDHQPTVKATDPFLSSDGIHIPQHGVQTAPDDVNDQSEDPISIERDDDIEP